jgi:uncharacterized protein (TIGR04141 family)
LIDTIPDGFFIEFESAEKEPTWLDYIGLVFPNIKSLGIKIQSPSAALWIPYEQKIFIITFGYAHTKILDDWTEPTFGKSVALCLIPKEEGFISIAADQVFAKWHKAQERAPKSSELRAFGFDPNRDLVEAIEGKIEKKHTSLLGERVRGGRPLKVEVNFENLLQTLSFLAGKFDSTEHEERYPSLHQMTRVTDSTLLEQLDNELGKLMADNPQTLRLSAPSWGHEAAGYPEQFSIGNRGKTPTTTPNLSWACWESYLKKEKKLSNVAESKKTKIHLIYDEPLPSKETYFYNCISAEVNKEGIYILSSGSWFKANHNFVTTTNSYIASLESKIPEHKLQSWDGIEHEGDYNKRIFKTASGELLLFDAKNIHYGGGKSQFEFCDLMCKSKKILYFVKKAHGSSHGSHLCEQVRRTIDNFFMPDASFRDDFKINIIKKDENTDVAWLNQRPKNGEWTFCLVLMGKHLSEIPFFAKCAIANLARQLEKEGHKIAFQKV